MFMTKKTCEQHLIQKLLYCTGEMDRFHKYMQDQAFLMQLLEWLLRGVSGVIMLNNPLSGALILTALSIASPWQALLGGVGLLSSTVMAILIGEERAAVSSGEHGYNGMLVALLISVSSSAGDWYWWLLLPASLAGATTTLVHSGLTAVLDRWNLPVSVFPFNTVLLLYLACTGIENPYYPNHPVLPQVATQSINSTNLNIPQLMQGALLGVGQVYACDALGSSIVILVAVLLYSPVLAFHALLGSSLGVLAGLSVAVQHDALYTGLASFNGTLGCMAFGGLLFTLSWRTHIFAIICAFLSSYAHFALSNLLANVGLPASSWASTLTISLLLLVSEPLTCHSAVRQDSSPGSPVHTPSQCAEDNTDSSSV
ncbi:urea transporter 2 [Neoarius graeffei]|uniref:urea transporter 2 n=1 Tax=Neoarius graeffei TaxID=443677 RepID=UPI00298C783D|nr:urea transporter 2 [Neoarius graeffei]